MGLDPPSWLEVFEALREVATPVMHTLHEQTRVNQIEGADVLEIPFCLNVFDTEGAVRWSRAVRFHRRKVDAVDVAIGMLIGKVHSPDTRARTYVKDGCRVLDDGCAIQSSV